MPLKEEFREQGNWMFRWRSFLPLIIVPIIIYGLWDSLKRGSILDGLITSANWTWICLAVSVLGLIIRSVTLAHTPKGTSGRNTSEGQIASTLNSRGMYATVRHPLYVGNFVIVLGVFLYTKSIWATLCCTLAYWLYYERIMYAEEEFLRDKFGKTYEDWASKTPAFIPRLSSWNKPDLSFSLRNIIKRENTGILGIIAIFTGLVALEYYWVNSVWGLPEVWKQIFIVGVIYYALIKLITKTTRLLQVEGR